MGGKSLISSIRLPCSSSKGAVEPAADENTVKNNPTFAFFAVLSFFSSLLFHKNILKRTIYCSGTWKLGLTIAPENQVLSRSVMFCKFS